MESLFEYHDKKTLAKVKICLCQINSSSLKNTIVVVTPQKNPKSQKIKWEKKTICQLSKVSFSDDLHILNQDFAIAPSAIKLPMCAIDRIPIHQEFYPFNSICLSSCQMTNVWQKCKKSLLCSISTLFLLGRWWQSQNTANA